ncbi:hypothetical protein LOK74_14175 [Brevibacillus humidisoli]|uniref:hypothetical protein n=1 Tax=Brevibacillus humidisoli TaxID=2895522 RepID=UPI001E2C8C9F|nr:hypothetical protein [Brevibacillus humidisoli]UFJ39216.1 hypothetical protein LOK74_14175 [Brevibacillus humidisoli]
MAEQRNAFKTGERVTNAGDYVCGTGTTKRYETDETFAACPVSGQETTWQPVDDDEGGCGC